MVDPQGATVFIPFGHSPEVDLVAEAEGGLMRIQVKTSTHRTDTAKGEERYYVQLATLGGNQSWTGQVKRLDPDRIEFLFVLVGSGRRWFIPAPALGGRTAITVGGAKYSEFEIERSGPIDQLVYGAESPPVESENDRGSAGVWRAGPACKVGALALSEFESHLPHQPTLPPRFTPSKYERSLGKSGEAVINQKRRVTLPQAALLEAGLRDGDRVRASSDAPGRVVLEKVGLPVWAEPA